LLVFDRVYELEGKSGSGPAMLRFSIVARTGMVDDVGREPILNVLLHSSVRSIKSSPKELNRKNREPDPR